MKNICLFISISILTSCGYPDLDNVPEFNDLFLTEDELLDYCSNINNDKKNIDKCISDYRSKSKL